MNKNIKDNDLDAMLKSYCTRKSQIAFDVELSENKSKEKRSRGLSLATSVVAIMLIFGVVFFQTIKTQNSEGTSELTPKGFSISASAAQREPVMLENVEVEFCPKEEKGLGGDINFENGMVSIEPVYFSMNGEDIETFDYKCEKGTLYYVIPELKEQMLTGDDGIKQDDYFQKGKKLMNIPYNSEDENYIFVGWYNVSIDEKAAEFFEKDITQISDEDMRNYRTDNLKTSEDFTNYFGDTITVTAHYKDGTKETAVIEVAVEIRESGDMIFGDYVLKYK